MKLKCDQQKIAEAITFASKIVSTSISSSIAQNVKLIAKGDTVEVRTTNLEQSVVFLVKDIEISEEGEICVHAKMLERLFRGFRPGSVEITSDEEMIVNIKHGGQDLKLYGYDPEEFPIFPEFDEKKAFLIPGKHIAEQINQSIFSVSKEKTRFAIDGVLFEMGEGLLTLVGTDGKRLSITKKKVDIDVSLPDNIIVPPNWLSLLSELVSKGFEELVKIQIVDNRIMALMGPVIMSSQLVAGVFPDFKAVLPESFQRKLIINREEFNLNLKQAEQFVSEASMSIKLKIYEDRIFVKSRSVERGEADIEISSEFSGGFDLINPLEDEEEAEKTKNDYFEIGFNPQYLTDILSKYPNDDFVMEMNDPDEPVRIQASEDFTYIVMPADIS